MQAISHNSLSVLFQQGGLVLGLGFLKTQFEGVFLELEESGMEYDTFCACYTFQKHKNTYSKFLAFFSKVGCPRLTHDLDFSSDVPQPWFFILNIHFMGSTSSSCLLCRYASCWPLMSAHVSSCCVITWLEGRVD